VRGIKTKGNPFALGTDGIIFVVLESMNLSMLCLANYLFVLIGLVDFERRIFMMNSCGALITPFKDTYDIKYQCLPTINLICKSSIHSWY
jgi:hypothetical protein